MCQTSSPVPEGMLPLARADRYREVGNSLVELVIGSAIAIAALVAVLSTCLHHHKLRAADAELSLVFSACRNSLEDLRTIPFNELPAMHGVGFDVPAANGTPGGVQPLPGDADSLPGEFSVVKEKEASGYVLYRVTATVTWSRANKPRDFELETIMTGRR